MTVQRSNNLAVLVVESPRSGIRPSGELIVKLRVVQCSSISSISHGGVAVFRGELRLVIVRLPCVRSRHSQNCCVSVIGSCGMFFVARFIIDCSRYLLLFVCAFVRCAACLPKQTGV